MTRELFNRDFTMTVGEQEIGIQSVNPSTGEISQALRVRFAVVKTGSSDPNTADVEIYNLGESNRGVLQLGSDLAAGSTAYDWPLVINAGYAGNDGQIFSGDIVFADSRPSSSEWVSVIEAEDGGKSYRSAEISKSFSSAVSVQVVLSELAKALGVGLGNSAAKFATSAESGFTQFDHGVALNGLVVKLLDKYVASTGYKWSIQDEQLQVLAPNETLLDTKVKLDKGLGLVESPERGEKGFISGTSLLNPNIKPGRWLELGSDTAEGDFKVTTVKHVGDTWGPEWYSHFEAKAI